ncbi:hypothetical protein MRX96_017414 [Rhipicephalus microplus]
MSEQTAFSTELLIDAIKHYPLLFDKCHPRYKVVEYKNVLWMKIAAYLGVTAALCQAKFKNLKDSFIKLKTKIKDKKKWAWDRQHPFREVEALRGHGAMEQVYLEPIGQDEVEEFMYSDILEADTVDLERSGSSTSDLSGRQAVTTDSPEAKQETGVLETEGEHFIAYIAVLVLTAAVTLAGYHGHGYGGYGGRGGYGGHGGGYGGHGGGYRGYGVHGA